MIDLVRRKYKLPTTTDFISDFIACDMVRL